MKTIVLLVAAGLAMPALADAPLTPAPAVAPTAQGGPTEDTSYLDKVSCKRQPPPTGTMLGSRNVCHTEREWREITQRSRLDIERRQTFHSAMPGEGP